MNKSQIILGILIGLMIVMLITAIVALAESSCEVDTSKAVIHHTASADVTSHTIDRWHKERGWDMIGYHFVIRANGEVEEGRPLSKKGAHALNPSPSRNHWVGIALTGYDEFTDAQIKALVALLIDLEVTHIERHHEECPGQGLDVEKIQETIRR